ncbi:GNAT family N-acetyltransferase [Micropruina sonneratiae]|uniref:GNAT family N-acetyltransferase n=1 Tax=Micropruina sonneratiae TaxID=2986940 RepID=UPI002227B4C2|nr:GNAT family N-acetyltransferase [Micropruina sp. KQZ13P-5]MCW3157208.1 GNAT family N-acetyltransferase [Micropruina sp. KQZ13P-5]
MSQCSSATGAVALAEVPEAAADRVLCWVLSSGFSQEWAPGEDNAVAEPANWAGLDGARTFLLTEGAEPVGYGEIWVEEGDDEAEQAHLVIDPQRQGEGLGRELTARLTERAASSASRVVLRVAQEDTRARAVYRSCGFRPRMERARGESLT